MGSNTCHFHSSQTRSSTSVCGPGSIWWASGKLGAVMPSESCLLRTHCGTSAAASVVGSRMSSVSSRSGSKALAAYVGGRLEPAHYLGAAKSGRVDGCQALGPGCSRRKKVGPWPGLVGISRP